MIAYQYDAAGRPSSLSIDGAGVLSQVKYYPFGAANGWTFATGDAYKREIDTDGRVSSVTLGPSAGTYGDIDQTYAYDPMDRLTSATLAAGQSQSFTYDGVGNRLTGVINAASTTYTYPGTSHRLSSLSGAVTRSFTYDLAGNLTASQGIAYTYDGRGRMKQAGATTYLVNALGQRVKKATGAAETYFAYDEAGHLVGEYDAAGSPIEETVWLGDTPVAVVRPAAGGGSEVFFVWTDQLDTPRVVSDDENRIRWEWDANDPFGNNAPDEDASGLGAFVYNLRFPGQYYDAETGVSYNYFRDYDPSIGRYVESDPIGLHGGSTTFSYVRSNPLRRADPKGLLDIFIGGAGDSRSRIVAGYQERFANDYPERSTAYYEWNQAAEAMDAIKTARAKNRCEPINIIGHSYGGSTATSLSKDLNAAGISVDLLITVDPVSRWTRVAGEAETWIDINAAPESSNGFDGDTLAWLGGKWGAWPEGKANIYYQAPFHHNEFGDLIGFIPPGAKSALQQLLDSAKRCSCGAGGSS